eukprot:4930148-Alexandrium_andersonii.AAC.1
MLHLLPATMDPIVPLVIPRRAEPPKVVSNLTDEMRWFKHACDRIIENDFMTKEQLYEAITDK